MPVGKKIQPARPTYQDVLDAPEHLVAEIIDSELVLSPRPAGPHTEVSSGLGAGLHDRFHGRGGGPRRPGGWRILDEPELHLPTDDGAEHVLVPDLAGWRLERMPRLPETAWFELPPDWVCEVTSPSSTRLDRVRKMPIYARHGVQWLWLVDPLARTLEVYELREGRWLQAATFDQRTRQVRAQPFDAVALDMRRWWPVEIEPASAAPKRPSRKPKPSKAP